MLSQGRADELGTSLGEDPPTDNPYFWCGCHATHMDPDHNTMLSWGKTLCNICIYNYDAAIIFFAHMEHMQHIRYGAQIQLYRTS
jgi:hypothetical protein